MNAEIKNQVLALEALDGPQLRQRWLTVTGQLAPSISPRLLRLALGYRLQANALGDLSLTSRRKLAQIAGGRSTTRPTSAGMRLVREWQGTTHVVTIDEAQTIRWNGQQFASLSAVARAITGGHWSGPAFFGLRSGVKSEAPSS